MIKRTGAERVKLRGRIEVDSKARTEEIRMKYDEWEKGGERGVICSPAPHLYLGND